MLKMVSLMSVLFVLGMLTSVDSHASRLGAEARSAMRAAASNVGARSAVAEVRSIASVKSEAAQVSAHRDAIAAAAKPVEVPAPAANSGAKSLSDEDAKGGKGK